MYFEVHFGDLILIEKADEWFVACKDICSRRTALRTIHIRSFTLGSRQYYDMMEVSGMYPTTRND
jgi:hypothetical protein